MAFLRKQPIIAAVIVGLLIGIVSILGASAAYQATSSDRFCTSCHSMQSYIADEPIYQNSVHRNPVTGIHVGCADCHVPPKFPNNVIYKTKAGIRDLYSEFVNDFSDPAMWEMRRDKLSYKVRDWFIETDSATCRNCHNSELIHPARERGSRQHELAIQNNVTCIGCHFDLVHQPVKLRESFLKYSRVEADKTRVMNLR